MTVVAKQSDKAKMSCLHIKTVVAAATLVVGVVQLVSPFYSYSSSNELVGLPVSPTDKTTVAASLHSRRNLPHGLGKLVGLPASPTEKTKVAASLHSHRNLPHGPGNVASKIGPIVSNDYGWKNDYNVVHVVNTRFMQHQPNLEHLGMARLDLFKTFTLPSMRQQSNQQFLWLIWTDPNLQSDLQQGLLDAVGDIPNVIVLGAYNEQEDNLRTFYGYKASELKESILSGDSELLVSYQEASIYHVLVETDLDADDAFSKTFVETAQAHAAYGVGHDFRISSVHTETFCPEFHAEWRYFAKDDENANMGELVHFHDKNFCIKSGMTVVYNTHAEARRLAACNNHDDLLCCAYGVPTVNNRRFLKSAKIHGGNEQTFMNIVPVWKNQNGLFDGEVNNLNFYEAHRNLVGSFDNKYFFNNEAMWRQVVSGSCSVRENFEDNSFIDGLTMSSDSGAGTVVSDGNHISYWFDAVSFQWKTTITYQKGMYGMGGFFNIAALGFGSGELFVDAIVDGKEAVRIPGNNTGFFGFVSTVMVTTVEFTVDTRVQGYTGTNAEEFVIDYLEFVSPPTVTCTRRLSTLPENDSEMDNKINSFQAAVLMSRTPTAAGMKNVLPGKTGGDKNSIALDTYKNDQKQAWEYIEYNFGVPKEAVLNVHQHLDSDMTNILVDGFLGQCTHGHSCKESTKRALGRLIDQEHLRKSN